MTELYIISPEKIQLNKFKLDLEEAVSTKKVAAFQLRIKNESIDVIENYALQLKPICHKYGVNFIINDHATIAKNVDADGVHVGEEKDGTVEEARKILGEEKIVGASCYGSVDRAIDMCEKGASYVAFGAFYDTNTKTPKARPNPEILTWWVTNSVIPCVAIGGIKAENCQPIIAAGADFIAVVSAIWTHKDGPKAAVEELYKEINSH